MADLAAEQFSDGSVGSTVPTVIGHHSMEEWERFMGQNNNQTVAMRRPKPGTASILDGSAGWGDAAVIIPWTMYLCYGDKAILERQFDSAKAWVDYMATCAKNSNELYQHTPAYQNYTDGERNADYIWDTRIRSSAISWLI
jgi:alpha-L-rhamnosidase